ncbi:MAG: aminotransferase class V-fold PLP-dependent enzyme [Lachnospiraceae bacterium]|nr:aminotransferase class V-fold PLP-dependent enzyme [Lachnospiraceae bacterium]
MEKTYYFDNAATTFPKPECVYTKMDQINRTLAVNAGRGFYRLAKEAVHIIDDLRMELLNLVNVTGAAEVVLTSSATFALNQIIGGMGFGNHPTVYVSPFEHNAVIRTLHQTRMKYANMEVIELPTKITELSENIKQYEIDMEQVKFLFSKNPPTHIFASHVSNVIGYILPVKELFSLAKTYDAVTVLDASQSLALVPIDFTKMNADFIVFAGHKTPYGPFGIGGFYMRKGFPLQVFLAGGTGTDSLNPEMPKTLPGKYEPASPNILAAGGLLETLKFLKEEGKGDYQKAVSDLMDHEENITSRMLEALHKSKDILLYLPPEKEHVGVVALNIKNYMAADVGMILDEDYSIAVRTGYHCAPLIHKLLKDEGSAGVVRVSISRFTTMEDVAYLVNAVGEIAEG